MGKRTVFVAGMVVVWAAAVAGQAGRNAAVSEKDGRVLTYPNDAGQATTFSTAGPIDLQNPFFQDLGTNTRTCASCHQPDSAWTITPANLQRRFLATRGNDAVFRSNDGSNCEGAIAASVAEKRAAYSLLLTRGLIRVGLDLPANAEFTIDSVRDPYACTGGTTDVSVYRRPLPSVNLPFVSAVMWDGRESSAATLIHHDLLNQANDATRGHAAGLRDLTESEAAGIVAFETSLYTTQSRDRIAGSLSSNGAAGGPVALASQEFHLGINDPVGLDPNGGGYDPRVFSLFNAWRSLDVSADAATQARRAIARGQEVFNTKRIMLSGVGGLNNQTFQNGVTLGDPVPGTCTICHDTPNAGTHSVKAPLNIGLTDPAVAPYLPVITLRHITTGVTIDTTDPGRALITGKWSDIGRFKGPVLRALSSRAPYFHNGSAATLEEVIDFYERRFQIGLTPQERSDLLAFLRAL
jgi:cytochrome c peroxidase